MADDFTADLSVRASEEAARRTRIVMEQAAEAARTSEAQACATADKCLAAHLVVDKVASKEVAATPAASVSTPAKKKTSFLETPEKQAAPRKLFEQEVAVEKVADDPTPSTTWFGEDLKIAIAKLANHFHAINQAKKAELAKMSVQGGAEHDDDDDDDDKVVDDHPTRLSSPGKSIVVGQHVAEMPQIQLFQELAEQEAKLDVKAKLALEGIAIDRAADIVQRSGGSQVRNASAYTYRAATKAAQEAKEQAEWDEYWDEEGDGDEG
jgi:hypothetical protein